MSDQKLSRLDQNPPDSVISVTTLLTEVPSVDLHRNREQAKFLTPDSALQED